MSNSVVARLAWVVLILAWAAARAQASAGVKQVTAEGAPDRLWVAEVVVGDQLLPPGTPQDSLERTRVYVKVISGTDSETTGWQRPMLIGAGVKDLAWRGSQLVALLKTGEWMFVWPDGRSTGPALPAGGRMVAVGSDGNTVWAVGRVDGGMAAASTKPATREAPDDDAPAASAAAPATRTAASEPATMTTMPAAGPPKLVLFRLELSSWIPDAELPGQIPVSSDAISLAVIRGKMILSAVVGGQVLVFDRADDRTWAPIGTLTMANAPVVRAKVLEGADRPIVWATGATGAGVLFAGPGLGPKAGHGRQAWAKPVELRVKGDLSQPVPRDVAMVANRVKMVYAKGEKLYEQAFDAADGAAVGEPLLILPASGFGAGDSRVGTWMNVGIMGLLLLVMVGAMRRRGEIEETMRHLDRVPLAPLGLRIAAAVVDLWPIWAMGFYVRSVIGDPDDLSAYTDPIVQRATYLAVGIYILHTLLLEMLTGASIGKWLFGLRVVQLNGDRAKLGSLFVRNVMRAVDLPLMVGAVMIVVSPLRQRIGDLAAGTIVVRRGGIRREQNDAEEPEELAETGNKRD